MKLVFINSYGNLNGEQVALTKNIPYYNCVDCDGWWPLEMWKGVEEHLDGKDCAEFLGWLDHYSENPELEWLEGVN
jgi:hypothetical protein